MVACVCVCRVGVHGGGKATGEGVKPQEGGVCVLIHTGVLFFFQTFRFYTLLYYVYNTITYTHTRTNKCT